MKGFSMFSKYFTGRNIYAFSALALLALLLAACGVTNAPAHVSTNLSSDVTATTSTVVGGKAATATLKHQPVGTANLSWDHTTHMLTIQLMMTGLAPSSIHPVHIDQGSCGSSVNSGVREKTVYPLTNITADSHGVVNTSLKVNVPNGIPDKNWYIDVHNGPGVANSDEAASIACANVVNHNTSKSSSQSVQTALEGTNNGNQNVSGTAHLSLSGTTLTVKLDITGLAPRSDHMVHIHAGSCSSQGPVIYPLQTLKADASGKATTTTTIQNVMTIPANGWFVNVHNSTDLSTQTGFDPITCGDVVLT
jgi:Cu/Zn superoxide dismutase